MVLHLAFAQDRGLTVLAREVTGKADFDVGRQVAVIIGIDRYKEWPPLRSAVSEAKKVKAVLEERYYIDEIFELYDTDASAANIRRLFVDSLPKKIGAKDSLLVFYAGHGQLDATKTGVWIASDGSSDIYAQNNWIPNAQLRNMIVNLKAQRILILADACFSGDFLNVSRGASPIIDSAYYKKALQLTARQVLTSGASESVPDESEFGAQLINLLERNAEKLLDPYAMFDRIRLGVTKTLPLMGSLSGNEQGASFVLFLKPQGNSVPAASATPTLPPASPTMSFPRAYGSIVITAASPGSLYLDEKAMGDLPAGIEARLDSVEVGNRVIELRYSESDKETKTATVKQGTATDVRFAWKKPVPLPSAEKSAVPVVSLAASPRKTIGPDNISNGTFDKKLNPERFFFGGPEKDRGLASYTATAVKGELKIAVKKSGDISHYIQGGYICSVKMKQGKNYLVSFKARSTVDNIKMTSRIMEN